MLSFDQQRQDWAEALLIKNLPIAGGGLKAALRINFFGRFSFLLYLIDLKDAANDDYFVTIARLHFTVNQERPEPDGFVWETTIGCFDSASLSPPVSALIRASVAAIL